jgi:hypothetical protein
MKFLKLWWQYVLIFLTNWEGLGNDLSLIKDAVVLVLLLLLRLSLTLIFPITALFYAIVDTFWPRKTSTYDDE